MKAFIDTDEGRKCLAAEYHHVVPKGSVLWVPYGNATVLTCNCETGPPCDVIILPALSKTGVARDEIGNSLLTSHTTHLDQCQAHEVWANAATMYGKFKAV